MHKNIEHFRIRDCGDKEFYLYTSLYLKLSLKSGMEYN